MYRFILSGKTFSNLSVDVFLDDCSKVASLVEMVSEWSHMNKPSPKFIALVNMHVETFIAQYKPEVTVAVIS